MKTGQLIPNVLKKYMNNLEKSNYNLLVYLKFSYNCSFMSGQGIAQFIPLILIFIIFFLLIRPQQKRVKDHKAMVESLKEEMKL